MGELRKQIIDRTHAWIRDCGLDVRDVEAFVDRELLLLIKQDRAATVASELQELLKAVKVDDKHSGASWYRGYVSARMKLRRVIKERLKHLTPTNSETDQN